MSADNTPIVGVASGHCRVTRTLAASELVDSARDLLEDGLRLALVSGRDDGTRLRITYLFTGGPPDHRVELEVPLDRAHPSVPTLAGVSFPASRFERELRDLLGVEPVGHPQPRRLVLHQHWPEHWHPLRHDAGDPPPLVDDAGSYPFVPVEGPGVYEIPVGPVHAGLIEPGHFRFWVVGETILRMKARLWFVHKGIERQFEGLDRSGGLTLAERISGDSAVCHGLAYCQAVEDAHAIEVTEKASALRSVLLEMERLYNHVADIGALCNDVGFGLAQAWALDLRERLLRLNREVTGHRLLRGGVDIGGASVSRMPSGEELSAIADQFEEIVDLATSRALVMDRFRGAAVLDRTHATELGVVGVAGRASGLPLDARVAHPFAPRTAGFTPATRAAGDVLARFEVRVEEVRSSLALIADYADVMDTLSDVGVVGDPRSDRRGTGVGIVEGWRGTLLHRVELDGDGRLARVKVVDPSFHNWPALPVSLADTIVPDFPLANKSFNLSYAGNDL